MVLSSPILLIYCDIHSSSNCIHSNNTYILHFNDLMKADNKVLSLAAGGSGGYGRCDWVARAAGLGVEGRDSGSNLVRASYTYV